MQVSDKRQTNAARSTPIVPRTVHGRQRFDSRWTLLVCVSRMTIESDRVTLRLSAQDLADLDLLISTGAYSTRSDAIRAAIRDFVTRRAPEVKQQMEARQTLMDAVTQKQQLQQLHETLKAQQEVLDKLMQK